VANNVVATFGKLLQPLLARIHMSVSCQHTRPTLISGCHDCVRVLLFLGHDPEICGSVMMIRHSESCVRSQGSQGPHYFDCTSRAMCALCCAEHVQQCHVSSASSVGRVTERHCATGRMAVNGSSISSCTISRVSHRVCAFVSSMRMHALV
jgi:hypothetical protein